MRRIFLRRIAAALALLSPAARTWPAELLEYDPAAEKDKELRRPSQPVEVSIDPARPLLKIPPRFYGLNVHPGSSRYEFARADVLKALKPDAIRIMTLQRSDWLPKAGRKLSQLSTRPGEFNWQELDLLLQGILSMGAEPFLALGFGPPQWISRAAERERRPPPSHALKDYAEFMATIVHRYAVEKRFPVHRISVDNEPENVGYSIDDYIALVRIVKEVIRARAPNVEVGGPAIGYARWPQPGGKSLAFANAVRYLHSANTPFDFFDWHIYSTSADTVLRTVNVVSSTYGKSLPLVISELNRDWRYSGEGKARSVEHNTGWDSVAWLAYLYDNLQQLGVSQVFYFNWRENTLGLTNMGINELRPNYFLFWTLTNKIGRSRVHATSSQPAIGCIATADRSRLAALVYNRTKDPVPVVVRVAGASAQFAVHTVDEAWVSSMRNGVDKVNQLLPQPQGASADMNLTVPPGGFVVIGQA